MLTQLIEGVQEAFQRRDLDYKKIAILLEEAKGIHYGTIQIVENIAEIEDGLEEAKVFDLLLVARSYLIMYCQFELKRDWWNVVDQIKQSTAMVDLDYTVNRQGKQEYYRTTVPNMKEFRILAHPSSDYNVLTKDYWRANDWLAVLWLMSFIPSKWIETLK